MSHPTYEDKRSQHSPGTALLPPIMYIIRSLYSWVRAGPWTGDLAAFGLLLSQSLKPCDYKFVPPCPNRLNFEHIHSRAKLPQATCQLVLPSEPQEMQFAFALHVIFSEAHPIAFLT